MGLERVRQVVDAANELAQRSDRRARRLSSPPIASSPSACRIRSGRPNWRGCTRRSASTRSSAITTGGTTSTACARALAKVRMPVMENDAVLLGAPGQPLLAGRPRRPDRPSARAEHASAASTICPARSRASSTDDPVILLVHEPDIFTEVPARVALTIAGHTHGGQIRLPFVPPVWVPSAYGARFAYGHIVEERPPHDRVGRARLQQRADASRRAAGDRAHHAGRSCQPDAMRKRARAISESGMPEFADGAPER